MSRHPLALALLAALATAPALAQEAPQATADRASTLDTIIVTGTRVADRTVAESQSPIDIISSEALQATGTTELATALSRALPSLNFPRPALVDGTSAIRPAQLRGLAPDQVLVLVNGKRRHTSSLLNLNGTIGRGSAPVDLNTIPVSAIDRVEVLRDGASAQYGSDAIAGVVNVVLKGARQGGSLQAQYGGYSAGDGKQSQLSGDAGLALGDDRGFLHLSAQLGQQDHTNRARPFAGTPGPTQPEPGQKAFVIGEPEVDAGAVAFNLDYALGEHVSAYAFGSASNRDITSFAFFRAPGNPTQNIPSIYPDGFLPEINNISKDRAIVAGLKGFTEGGWNWDLSYNYGYNHLEFYTRNTLNATLGPDSPTEFYDGALETTQNILNLDVSRQFDWGLAYPATLSFGLEARNEKWNQSPGEYGSYADAGLGVPGAPPGAQGFGGFAPEVSGAYDRDSYAAYVGLEADFTEKFSAGVAARYEDFDDFGSQASGKLSARYAFTDAVALRGTVSSGFRAPSLAQQYFQTVSTVFLPGIPTPFEIRTFPASSAVAQAFGAEPLQPEESLSYSLGLVLQPADGLYVTVDAYQIDVDDRIALSSNLTGEGVRALLESRGIYGVNGGRYFTNAIDTRTRGVDVVGTWRVPLQASTLDLTAGYNHTRTEITRIAPNPEELEESGLNLERIDRVEIGRIEQGFPRNKLLLGSVWNASQWTLSATATRYGSVRTTPNNPELDQEYGAKWLLDVSASYRPDERWTLTLGADNVLDEYPDENSFGNSTNGQFPYSNLSPFGFGGAFVYGKVGYRW
ncbi:iron complex outermembrane receptor protein [Luteimonas sp. J16]|jgi:iron complex outermembrane receptor protein|uniref:TonB-dependent receptor plug domain-containing protein n=1 Tax=unclassified Luteimonas TaxID=2629088 RepID=UPI000478CED7|nr:MULTISPECIES: TonB-dependent receptor [unclassified Luteimonas]TWG90474.1 iron complex outermembrane receptor protein [Luteimonas sp. J16]